MHQAQANQRPGAMHDEEGSAIFTLRSSWVSDVLQQPRRFAVGLVSARLGRREAGLRNQLVHPQRFDGHGIDLLKGRKRVPKVPALPPQSLD